MKKTANILAIIIVVSMLATCVIGYVGGRKGGPLSIALFPASIVPILIGVLALGFLFVALFIALTKRRDRVRVVLLLSLSVVFFILMFDFGPDFYKAGFRARIKSQITPEELRELATNVQTLLPEGGRLPGPMKNLWSEDYRQQWNDLVQKTAVGKLDPWLVIDKDTQSVVLSWGGALVGHWGVIIDTGSEQAPGDIATGIKTYISPN